MTRQPFLHDLLVAYSAPTQTWSAPDGQIRPGGLAGWYHCDVRIVSHLMVTVDGLEPEVVASGPDGQGRATVIAAVRGMDDPTTADPTVRLTRTRTVIPGKVCEELVVSSARDVAARGRLRIEVAGDLAAMEDVKSARQCAVSPPASLTETTITWTRGAVSATLSAPGARIESGESTTTLTWDLVVPARGDARVVLELLAEDRHAVVRAPERQQPEWDHSEVHCPDSRVRRLVDQALADVAGLRMATVDAPQDVFLAAGAPWFFTLFGRDSLISARFLLPLTTQIAAGTLRTLARRQGTRIDVVTAQQPGKIAHELRRAAIKLDERTTLPPLYYGTIDATALWISVLHDAWRAGMPTDEVHDLVDTLDAALVWMRDHGTVDGFLSYIDDSGSGLTNQGWKDSGDSVQFRDGTLAEGPIALVEVQAYAYKAALDGAALLDECGRDGTQWRDWAAELKKRFHERFWSVDELGPYLVIALDGAGRPVDTVTSNMGHVLGTGILDADQARAVADRLVHSTMSSGYGLRTMSTTSGGYFPWKYHGGSVWPHDTALAIEGLLAEGMAEEARLLATGLLDAAEDFDFRLPELFAGDAKGSVPRAVAYPASCRPQAWAAAAAIPVARALGALEALAP